MKEDKLPFQNHYLGTLAKLKQPEWKGLNRGEVQPPEDSMHTSQL